MARRCTPRSWRGLAALVLAGAASAARAAAPPRADAGSGILQEMNRAMIRLAERVSPSVVQVLGTGYRPAAPGGRTESAFVARQRAVGSGVIVASDGYVLTNHHVVRGAQRIQVLLPLPPDGSGPSDEARRLLDARVVGADPELDHAVGRVVGHARGLVEVAPAGEVFLEV